MITLLLLPFSFLFFLTVALRKWFYRVGFFKTHRFSVPVIVVGNITVGGTGKTPLVIALAQSLKKQGRRPGIVSRGYGAVIKTPTFVWPDSPYRDVGDEPLLIAKRVDCPVVVFPKRVKAVEYLLKNTDCDVVICDDGLQHYALVRDIEIVVIDGERNFGNGYCLPAGPLRETTSRLKTVNYQVYNNGTQQQTKAENAFEMKLIPDQIMSVKDFKATLDMQQLKSKIVHAVAGIGNPRRFFETLRAMKLRFFEHPFPDHHLFKPEDFNFGEDAIILMTEKDAVKCTDFADDRFWFLRVTAKCSLLDKLHLK